MIESVHHRATFEALAQARRHRHGPLTVSAVATTQRGPAVAYAVGRHLGSAPVRNRIRRRLRALVREHEGALDPRHAYLVSAGRGARDLTFSDMRNALSAGFRDVENNRGTEA